MTWKEAYGNENGEEKGRIFFFAQNSLLSRTE